MSCIISLCDVRLYVSNVSYTLLSIDICNNHVLSSPELSLHFCNNQVHGRNQ